MQIEMKSRNRPEIPVPEPGGKSEKGRESLRPATPENTLSQIHSFILASLSYPSRIFLNRLVKELKRITGFEVAIRLSLSGETTLIARSPTFSHKIPESLEVTPSSPDLFSFPIYRGKETLGFLLVERGENRELPAWMKDLFSKLGRTLGSVVRLLRENEFLKTKYRLQKILSQLLGMTLEDAPIEEILNAALEFFLELETLHTSRRGAICILSQGGKLEMVAQKGVGEEILKKCRSILPGECLCGEAFKEKRPQVKRHADTAETKSDHEHLFIPVTFRKTALGLINLYIKDGEKPERSGLEIAQEVARMLGAIIYHYRQEEGTKFHSQILSQFTSGVLAQDREGRVTYINPQGERILGKEAKRVLERNLKRLFPEIGSLANNESKEIAFQGREGITYLEAFTFPLKDVKMAERVTLLQDVTLRKIAEEARRKAEERFRVLFETAQEGVVFASPDGEISFANESAAKILGYEDPEELKGRKTEEFYADPEEERLLLQDLARDGYVRGREIRLKGKEGTVVYTLLSVVPINGESAGPSYGVVFTDITARKKAEEESRANLDLYKRLLEETVNAFSSLAETRDPYLAGHQTRVTGLACAIAREMGLEEERIKGLRYAALLHDLGKLGIPLEILSKPGKLNEMEFNLIKIHPQISYSILKNIPFPWPVAEIAFQHHERLDGSGYPRGLKGEEILLEARILAVADVVEAMSSHRPYRPALGIEEALKEIESKKGKLYDPEVVDACLRLFKEKGYKFS
jgi:PAS domain S-box-containing protein